MNFRKMAFNGYFCYYSFVKFQGKEIWKPQYDCVTVYPICIITRFLKVHVKLDFILIKANTMNPGQTAPGPYCSCTDLEGGVGGKRGMTPMKNHKNIGFLSNIDPDPL